MADIESIEPGTQHTFTRTFTRDDVDRFAQLSRDEGYHHLVADEDGTVIVHGLLTATLPTKLGGDLDFVARTMAFEFPQPVFTGQTVTCVGTVESCDEHEDRYALEFSFECTTADGSVVLRGESEGVVFKDRPM